MGEAYRVIVTARASKDLHSVYDYVSKDSQDSAARVVDQILGSMDSLATFPHRYPVIRASRRPPRETRLMPVRPYLVYYRVIDSERVVLVLRVDHGARRRPRRLQ